MFADDFREILDTYEKECKKDFRSSESDIKNILTHNITKLLGENLIVRAFCGRSNWATNPWINIIDESFDNFQEALTIEYKFDTKNSSVALSLIPRLKVYSEYTSIRKYLIRILDNIETGNFTIPENSYSILSRNYSYDELNDKILTEDLNRLISIYTKLTFNFKITLEEIRNPRVFYSKGYEQADACYSIVTDTRPRVKDIHIEYPEKNSYRNYLTSPEELFTDENTDKIIRCDISIDDYRKILTDIKQDTQLTLIDTIRQYGLDLSELDIRDKILLFAKSFTEVSFKSIGRQLGSYSFGRIRVDDRLPDSLIITSIIHELAHFILEKILKEVLMKILDTNDTPLISAYVRILLEDNDLNYLMDEFCAHTVEGRFALFGFQDYSSFNYKLNEISHLYSKEDIDYGLVIANSFAYDIKDILEEFIVSDIREDIKEEFLEMSEPADYEPLNLEIESRLENERFIESLALILTTGIAETLNNPSKLERYMKRLS